jgi:uncharacterized repeat protein (TIGR03803 family)
MGLSFLYSRNWVCAGLPRTAHAWLAALTALALLGIGSAAAGQYRPIYNFKGQPDGAIPLAGLVMDPQGRLYGTTLEGGTYNLGTVFRLTPPASGSGPWTEEILHSFNTNDGIEPSAPVTLGSDGSVYGVASQAGLFQRGTVFSLANAPGWPFTVLHAFNSSEGGSPNSGLVFGSGGLLYGTTEFLSEQTYADTGTIFSISPLGDQVEYAVQHTFGRPGDGYGPVGLNAASATGFVGASGGGPNLNGNVYSFKTTASGHGIETILYSFGNPPDVDSLFESPIVGAYAISGSLYGCATYGGTNGHGGIYQIKLTPAGPVETVLYNFGDQPNDPNPGADDGRCFVVQADHAGKLYGTTEGGGATGGGAFFELDPPTSPRATWKETVDVSFSQSARGGFDPQGGPLLLGSAVYGTTTTVENGHGAVYQLAP